jgi:hypothetical protein
MDESRLLRATWILKYVCTQLIGTTTNIGTLYAMQWDIIIIMGLRGAR